MLLLLAFDVNTTEPTDLYDELALALVLLLAVVLVVVGKWRWALGLVVAAVVSGLANNYYGASW